MAAVRDLYDILGVRRDASAEDIKRAYRRLARELHPDVNGSSDAETRFKEVAGAYEILSDPQKRQRYDAFGTTGGPQGSPFTDVQDIFDLFFGGGGGFGAPRTRGGRGSRVRHGEDLRAAVRLGFAQAAFGSHHELHVDRLVVCDRCLGNGAEPGTAPVACRSCGGSGQLQQMRRSIFGAVMTASPCPTCDGTGEEILDRCEACLGQGRRREPTTIPVDVPAGVADGMELRIGGAGHAGRGGGPAGDLYVEMHVEASTAFDRRGQDLYTVLDVPVTLVVLGGEAQIETLEEPERIRIDPGTESGTIVRLRGKGVPNVNRRGRGDLYVTIHVVTPADLSREERGLFERFAELRGESASKREPFPGELRRPADRRGG
jgi:molecular chaperone DnaJ